MSEEQLLKEQLIEAEKKQKEAEDRYNETLNDLDKEREALNEKKKALQETKASMEGLQTELKKLKEKERGPQTDQSDTLEKDQELYVSVVNDLRKKREVYDKELTKAEEDLQNKIKEETDYVGVEKSRINDYFKFVELGDYPIDAARAESIIKPIKDILDSKMPSVDDLIKMKNTDPEQYGFYKNYVDSLISSRNNEAQKNNDITAIGNTNVNVPELKNWDDFIKYTEEYTKAKNELDDLQNGNNHDLRVAIKEKIKAYKNNKENGEELKEVKKFADLLTHSGYDPKKPKQINYSKYNSEKKIISENVLGGDSEDDKNLRDFFDRYTNSIDAQLFYPSMKNKLESLIAEGNKATREKSSEINEQLDILRANTDSEEKRTNYLKKRDEERLKEFKKEKKGHIKSYGYAVSKEETLETISKWVDLLNNTIKQEVAGMVGAAVSGQRKDIQDKINKLNESKKQTEEVNEKDKNLISFNYINLAKEGARSPQSDPLAIQESAKKTNNRHNNNKSLDDKNERLSDLNKELEDKELEENKRKLEEANQRLSKIFSKTERRNINLTEYSIIQLANDELKKPEYERAFNLMQQALNLSLKDEYENESREISEGRKYRDQLAQIDIKSKKYEPLFTEFGLEAIDFVIKGIDTITKLGDSEQSSIAEKITSFRDEAIGLNEKKSGDPSDEKSDNSSKGEPHLINQIVEAVEAISEFINKKADNIRIKLEEAKKDVVNKEVLKEYDDRLLSEYEKVKNTTTQPFTYAEIKLEMNGGSEWPQICKYNLEVSDRAVEKAEDHLKKIEEFKNKKETADELKKAIQESESRLQDTKNKAEEGHQTVEETAKEVEKIRAQIKDAEERRIAEERAKQVEKNRLIIEGASSLTPREITLEKLEDPAFAGIGVLSKLSGIPLGESPTVEEMRNALDKIYVSTIPASEFFAKSLESEGEDYAAVKARFGDIGDTFKSYFAATLNVPVSQNRDGIEFYSSVPKIPDVLRGTSIAVENEHLLLSPVVLKDDLISPRKGAILVDKADLKEPIQPKFNLFTTNKTRAAMMQDYDAKKRDYQANIDIIEYNKFCLDGYSEFNKLKVEEARKELSILSPDTQNSRTKQNERRPVAFNELCDKDNKERGIGPRRSTQNNHLKRRMSKETAPTM